MGRAWPVVVEGEGVESSSCGMPAVEPTVESACYVLT